MIPLVEEVFVTEGVPQYTLCSASELYRDPFGYPTPMKTCDRGRAVWNRQDYVRQKDPRAAWYRTRCYVPHGARRGASGEVIPTYLDDTSFSGIPKIRSASSTPGARATCSGVMTRSTRSSSNSSNALHSQHRKVVLSGLFFLVLGGPVRAPRKGFWKPSSAKKVAQSREAAQCHRESSYRLDSPSQQSGCRVAALWCSSTHIGAG